MTTMATMTKPKGVGRVGLDDLDALLKELETDLVDAEKSKKSLDPNLPTIPIRSLEADRAFEHLRQDGAATSGQGLERWQYKGFGIWESNDDDKEDDIKNYGASESDYSKVNDDTSRLFNGKNDFGMLHNESDLKKDNLNFENVKLDSQECDDSVVGGSKDALNVTRELDDLMHSLTNFQMANDELNNKENQKVDNLLKVEDLEDKVKENNDPHKLDAMLTRLKDELKKEGVVVKEKGICEACQQPIVGQVITGLGKTFHPEHFVCAHCREPIGTANFFERDGQSYCEKDYHLLFSPKCAHCFDPIVDRCVTAMDATYHPRCFKCHECHEPFGDAGFHEREGKAFCQKCFFNNFAPKCGKCKKPIIGHFVSALAREWHPECFVCTECELGFDDGQYFEHDGSPLCETHYHALKGSLCDKCEKPISGRCITAMGRKFHPQCFVCAFCLRQLNKGTFKERTDKPYCHDCFDRLFG